MNIRELFFELFGEGKISKPVSVELDNFCPTDPFGNALTPSFMRAELVKAIEENKPDDIILSKVMHYILMIYDDKEICKAYDLRQQKMLFERNPKP